MRFTDKVCLVTGGGSGIGKATCERFAREGGKVVVVDLKQEHGDQTVQAITGAGGQAIFAKADVGNPNDIKGSINAAVSKWGRIDVVVNDAAMMTFKPIVDLPDEDWDKVLGVNLRAFFFY
jgi:glucose 1-dehydrogenase